jgi:CheY-like chemotaxis protein
MQGKKPKILCLDDQRDHLGLRKTFLEQFGCEVIAVEDAAGCFEAATREIFDVALLDYHLGGEITGEEVAHDLRRRYPDMPLIMLTGDPGIPDSAKESVDAVLIKGASDPGDLLDAIQKLAPNCDIRPRRKPMSREELSRGLGHATR